MERELTLSILSILLARNNSKALGIGISFRCSSRDLFSSFSASARTACCCSMISSSFPSKKSSWSSPAWKGLYWSSFKQYKQSCRSCSEFGSRNSPTYRLISPYFLKCLVLRGKKIVAVKGLGSWNQCTIARKQVFLWLDSSKASMVYILSLSCEFVSAVCLGRTNNKKSSPSGLLSKTGVEYGARTHDPRYHKPML